MNRSERQKIINFVKTKSWSYQLVADHFGVTRNAVAGVIFRHSHPCSERIDGLGRKRGSGRNKIGTGYRRGPYPLMTASNTR